MFFFLGDPWPFLAYSIVAVFWVLRGSRLCSVPRGGHVWEVAQEAPSARMGERPGFMELFFQAGESQLGNGIFCASVAGVCLLTGFSLHHRSPLPSYVEIYLI